MKVGLPTFMLTPNEPTPSQTFVVKMPRGISYENGWRRFHGAVCLWHASIMSVFIGTADEPTTVQKYAMKMAKPFS